MKFVSALILTSILFVGCASSDIRNWNADTKTGQIVMFTGEDMLTPPNAKDALDALMESGRCPTGYEIKEIGWRGGGWITRAEDTEDKISTSTSLNIGGKEVYSVERSKGSKSGNQTITRIGNFQTQKTANNNYTIVHSPAENQSSGEMRGKWFDFKCK